ncbi:MAG: pantoate--beta-alanine ligase [Fimbriimonadaceae bacterium]|nr:pantoate--beta-alanine ligase [Fimbriimonadaceae bacterium]
MGAFHEGHLELMRRARAECDHVVVSLFVNPTQFAPHEDLARYPRDFDRDRGLAEAVGVDELFAPDERTMYPRKTTVVTVSEVSDDFEGAVRPGHFAGVATVVLKLFNMVRPDLAYFGLKDLQQCAVIRRMVEDLNVPVRLSFVETHREENGLAMSSRNVYLSPEERMVAPTLYRSLAVCATAVAEARDASSVAEKLRECREGIETAGMAVQYLALVDPDTMREVSLPRSHSRLIVAAKLGSIRLIDNVAVAP